LTAGVADGFLSTPQCAPESDLRVGTSKENVQEEREGFISREELRNKKISE
jgi:hypothetical protein